MKLLFDNLAVTETRSGGVNFAGYYLDHDGRPRDVLCRITGEALGALASLANATSDDLLDAYH